MTEVRTLRCWRFFVFLAGATFMGGLLGGLMTFGALSSDVAWKPRVVCAVFAVILLGTAVFSLLSFRTCLILDEEAVTLVTALQRHRFTWNDIKEIWGERSIRSWSLRLRTAEGEQRLVLYPAVITGLWQDIEGRFNAPHDEAPRGFYKLHEAVRDEWLKRNAWQR